MAPSPDMPDAIWVLNPAERMIYYYHHMEGMPLPMGGLTTYGFAPKAIRVAGRHLRETASGVYSATVRFEGRGDYDFALRLAEPHLVHCFPFAVQPDPALAADELALTLALEPDDSTARVLPVGGGVVRLRVGARRGRDTVNTAALADVGLLVSAPGGWQQRVRARAVEGKGSVYEAPVTLPAPGVYHASVVIPSLGVRARDYPPFTLRATGAVGARP